MSRVLRYISNLMEDPDHPSIGPQLKLLTFTGLWRNLDTFTGKFKQFMFFTLVAFFFSQYIKCCIYFNGESLKLLLQYAPFHMGVLKACMVQKNFGIWQKLIHYVSSTELNQLKSKAEERDKLINGYISMNRKAIYFFWGMAFVTNFSIFTEPYQKNQVVENGTSVYVYMFDGYTPFQREPPGYYFAMCIQTVLGYLLSGYILGWDGLVVGIMIFFAGQLKISRLYCSQAIRESSDESHENIRNCHLFHTTLVKYQQLFRDLISPIMFAYLINISINLGVCITEIVAIKDDLGTVVSSCMFVMACLIQLLLFYWFSNEVTVESTFTSYGIFESDWTNTSNKLKKELLLLGLTTNKILLFTAGPFTNMTLATFLGILRGSYSFYTLLNSTS